MEWTYDAWNVFHTYALLLEKYPSAMKISWPNFIIIFAQTLPCVRCKNRFLPAIIKKNNSKLSPFHDSVNWHNWVNREMGKPDDYQLADSRKYYEAFDSRQIIESFDNYFSLLKKYRENCKPNNYDRMFSDIVLAVKIKLTG